MPRELPRWCQAQMRKEPQEAWKDKFTSFDVGEADKGNLGLNRTGFKFPLVQLTTCGILVHLTFWTVLLSCKMHIK